MGQFDAREAQEGDAVMPRDMPWQLLSEADLEAFEERAAILEYDAGLSREDAEKQAWQWIELKRMRKSFIDE